MGVFVITYYPAVFFGAGGSRTKRPKSAGNGAKAFYLLFEMWKLHIRVALLGQLRS